MRNMYKWIKRDEETNKLKNIFNVHWSRNNDALLIQILNLVARYKPTEQSVSVKPASQLHVKASMASLHVLLLRQGPDKQLSMSAEEDFSSVAT